METAEEYLIASGELTHYDMSNHLARQAWIAKSRNEWAEQADLDQSASDEEKDEAGRKQLAETLKLPSTARWVAIETAHRRMAAKSYGISVKSSWVEIAAINRGEKAKALGLDSSATWDEIMEASENPPEIRDQDFGFYASWRAAFQLLEMLAVTNRITQFAYVVPHQYESGKYLPEPIHIDSGLAFRLQMVETLLTSRYDRLRSLHLRLDHDTSGDSETNTLVMTYEV